jgi:putative inorganic carbon (HCO3(-)) transporter
MTTLLASPPANAERTQQGQPLFGRGARVDRTDLPAYLLLFLGGVVARTLSGSSSLIHLPLSPDRLLFAGSLALLLMDPGAWRQRRLRFRGLHVLIVAMLGLTIWSAAAHGTLTSSFGFYALLDRLVLPFLAFCLAPVIFSTPARRDLLLRVMTCLGLYLGATAVFEVVGPHGLVFPRFIMDPSVGIQFGRARGPFLGSEADGLVMASTAFVAGVTAVRFQGLWRWLGAFAAAVSLAGCLLTLTRSVWLGAVVGVVIVGVSSPPLRRLLPIGLAVGAAAVIVGLVFVPGLSDKVTARAGTERSIYDRQNVNAAAFRAIDQHPLDGVGWMKFLDVGVDYVRQSPTYPITNVNIEVHNVVLGRAAELGIPGAALWVACVIAGPVASVLRRRRPRGEMAGWRVIALGTLCAWGVAIMSSPVPYPLPNLLVWLFPGVLASGYLVRGAGDAT